MDVTTEQRSHVAAREWNMDPLNPLLSCDQLHCDMSIAADAGRAVGDRAGTSFCGINQITQRRPRCVTLHDKAEDELDDANDVGEVHAGIVGRLAQSGCAENGQAQLAYRIAVWLRGRSHSAWPQRRSRPRLVFDDSGLAQALLGRGSEYAKDHVDGRSGSQGHD